MMRVVSIVGARPQFVKAAMVGKVFAAIQALDEILVHTGQHYDADMSEVFFRQLDIKPPHYNLGVKATLHGAMTGRMLEQVEKVLLKERPELVVVYGDTNSTLAGALAATKLHIPIAHVEAGVRSSNRKMPEEINRIVTDHVSDILLAPTRAAVRNLQAEGVPAHKVHMVGDVMLDAVRTFRPRARRPVIAGCRQFEINSPLALLTIHRAENTGTPQRLKHIIDAVCALDKQLKIIFPVHPRTRKMIDSTKWLKDGIFANKNITLSQPLGYLELLYVLERCALVFTDSGGIQKEAYFFNKPCVTLREDTEWEELVAMGVNVLAGADKEKIRAAYKALANHRFQCDGSLYGKGRAAENIARVIMDEFGINN